MKVTAAMVAGLVGSILSKGFDEASASPDFHHELWDLACSENRYVAVAAPRGHAKSTAGTICYGLAMLLFREAKHVLIVSDTEAQAAGFVRAIASKLQDSQDLIELFGIKKNDKGEAVFLKDSETEIEVELEDGHRFRVLAKGAEQKLRGLLWRDTRPDLVLVDDLENDELVMNKDRRKKLKDWFFSALLPATSKSGQVRMWGTILHMDSLLESLMPSMTDRLTVKTPLKIWSKRKQMFKAVKYRAHDDKFDHILWPERFTREFFEEQRAERFRQGIPDKYSQEYLNEPIDDSVAFFKMKDLLPEVEKDKDKRLRYYITVDPAISEETTADYTVFCIAGVDEDRMLHVRNVIRERMDGREIVDLLLALHRTYDPAAIGIEEVHITKAIGPFLNEEMIKQNTYPSIVKMKHGGRDKIQRARSIQARMRARGVRFAKEEDWYPILEDELIKFPRARHDDQVDALAYMGLLLDKMIEAPTDREAADEEYELEYAESGITHSGRSSITGY